jgi:hypothetical protein
VDFGESQTDSGRSQTLRSGGLPTTAEGEEPLILHYFNRDSCI